MPDHKCTVTFTAPNTWNFNPKTLPVTGHDSTVTFESAPGSNWTFTSTVTGNPPLPADWSVSLIAGSSKLKITDPNNTVGNYAISVTVAMNGSNTTYTSPLTSGPIADAGVPPVIENSGTVPVPPKGQEKKG